MGDNSIRALVEKLKKLLSQIGTHLNVVDFVVHTVKRGLRQQKSDDR